MSQDFPCRKLRRNHSVFRPTRIIYLDSETKTQDTADIQKHRMTMAWVCYWEKRNSREKDTEQWRYFAQTKSMNEFIAAKAKGKTCLYVFGHNVFFDLQASDFFYYFTKWGWVLDFFYDKGMTYILAIRKDKATIKILSTTNYFPVSLKELGRLIGLEKKDVDLFAVDRETLSDYCKRDVEIIKAAMEYYIAFLDKHDLGKFCMTRSSQAMTAYRHRFMNKPIYPHQDEDVSEFERKAYMGGRVECFRLGLIDGGPFVSLDVNSMYPYVMKSFPYPTRLVNVFDYPDMDKIRYCLEHRAVCAKVWLRTDEPAYSVTRFKKLIFPVGTFSAYVCTEGLRYALNHGHLHEVERMAVYDKDWIFSDFVDYFHDVKIQAEKEGNTAMRLFTKLFLNGLYGKWAQKITFTASVEDITYDGYYRLETLYADSRKVEIETKLFNKRFIQTGEMTARNSLVAIAAHVTEYARVHLWRIIKDIGVDNVFYCDTDSIKIRKADLSRITCPIDQVNLGALKVEEEFKGLTVIGPKHFATTTTLKVKGVPARAEHLAIDEVRYLHFPRQDTHLRKQVTRYFITQPMTKKLDLSYTKGKVLEDGKVIPITLSEELPPSLLHELPLTRAQS